jgi:hypothetical protein
MTQLLTSLGPSLWIAEGPVVSFFGFAYSTRMAAIRLADRQLFIWSPVALTPALKAEIDALGTVRYLVSPNKLHHLYLGEWKAAYSQALLYAPPGLRKKRKDLAFDADLSDVADPAWASEIDQVRVDGSVALTEIVFFHRQSGTVLFTDLIQNFPDGWFKGWRGVLARLDGILAPHPGAPREWRMSFTDRRAAKAAVARILAWPIGRVVIAHGELPQENAAAFVRNAFGWLVKGG